MPDDVFSDDLRGYLRRRDHRVRSQDIEWPRPDRRSIAQVVAISTGVAVFVAGAIFAGFALLGSRSGSLTPANQGIPGTPAERADAAVAYDPETGQVVMFGGLGDNGSLGDTWIWNGSEWAQQQLGPSPLSRFGASMVYDAKLHQLVLFGGVPDQAISTSEQGNLNATWLWTGTGWQRIDTRHTPTSNGLAGIGVEGAMAYDAATGRVVLVTSATGIHFVACSTQTWTFDGRDWRLEAPATPLPAVVVAAVDEPLTGHVIAVLHARAAVAPAGLAGTSCPVGSPAARALPQSSTWRWTGSTWVEVSAGTEPEESALEIASNGTSVGLELGSRRCGRRDRQQRGTLVVERVAMDCGARIRNRAVPANRQHAEHRQRRTHRALRRHQPTRQFIRLRHVGLGRSGMAAVDRSCASDINAITGVVHRRPLSRGSSSGRGGRPTIRRNSLWDMRSVT